jgi:hypothetical protein
MFKLLLSVLFVDEENCQVKFLDFKISLASITHVHGLHTPLVRVQPPEVER